MSKIIILLLIGCASLYSVHYKFTYDNAGNESTMIMHNINGKIAIPEKQLETLEDNYIIQVFPNPTQGEIKVDISNSNGKVPDGKIEVYNLNGKLLLQSNLLHAS